MNLMPGVFSSMVSKTETSRSTTNSEESHPTNSTNTTTTIKPRPGILRSDPSKFLSKALGNSVLIKLGKNPSTH